jgi:hypothetical protein
MGQVKPTTASKVVSVLDMIAPAPGWSTGQSAENTMEKPVAFFVQLVPPHFQVGGLAGAGAKHPAGPVPPWWAELEARPHPVGESRPQAYLVLAIHLEVSLISKLPGHQYLHGAASFLVDFLGAGDG